MTTMVDTFRVVVDNEAIDDFFLSDAMREIIMDAAIEPTGHAQELAPRLTGAGADSIHAEPYRAAGLHEWQARISWERVYYYMYFHEKGTVTLPARPFLVPALNP